MEIQYANSILNEDLVKKIEKLLEEGYGNIAELEHILKLLREGRRLARFDQKYLEIVLQKITPGYRGATSYKSEGTSLVLSLFFGMFGIMGVGHRYVGNVRRSIAIMYSGWAIMMTPLWLYSGLLFAAYQKIAALGGYMPPMPGDLNYTMNFFATGLIIFVAAGFVLGYFAFLIWQIFDARNQTRKFNEYMDKTGVELFEVTIAQKIVYAIALVLPILTVFMLAALVGTYLNNLQHSSSSIYP